ncbi:MAG TPA: nodulation protein NfeD, partial [Candidatus Polarisedimenticolia bacterium]|nr:nodulation protein NfeD [Candidatus Polarisedimenticolia bacterium]
GAGGPIVAGAIEGIITGVTHDYVRRTLDRASSQRAPLVIFEMDTPGGLVDATEAIVQEILASRAPVAVHVTPSGAQAASAGLYIANAADIIAMAPGTRMGAGHPVTVTGGSPGGDPNGRNYLGEKIENDLAAGVRSVATQRGRNAEVYERMVRESISLTEREALDQKVIDLVAAGRSELLAALQGREVARFDGSRALLDLSGRAVDTVEMTTREKIFSWIAHPQVAVILMAIGMLGLYVEFSNPGLIVPGAVGGLALILFAMSIQILPINLLGLLLVALAIALFVLEVKFTSFGLLTLAGVAALALGIVTLFDVEDAPALRIPLGFVVPTSVTVGLVMLAVTTVVVKAHRSRVATGAEGLAGEVGTTLTDLVPGGGPGKVFVHGEYWDATSSEPIPRGARVRVKGVRHMGLVVEPDDR